MNQELSFINTFIKKRLKNRYLDLLQNDTRRKKIIKRFYHSDDIDERFKIRIEPNKQNVNDIFKLLTVKRQIRYCYIISTSSEIDQEQLLLYKALEKIVGFFPGTIISCIPGLLAYYEGEEPNERFIIEKRL